MIVPAGRTIVWRRLPAVLLIAVLLEAADLAEISHQAKEAMVAGKYQEAIALYRGLVKALPDNPGLRMNLGLALHSAGQYREAIQNFESVVKQQPDATDIWLLVGLDHLKLGEPRQSIAPLERVVRADESNQQVRLELAEAYLSSGEAQQAAAQFEILTRRDPGFAKGWQGLGLSYMALSRQTFEKLEKIAPGSGWRDVLLARSLLEKGRVHSAFRFYREALAKQPDLPGIHAGLAEVYRKNNHADWAEVEETREKDLPPPACGTPSLECEFLAGHYEGLLGSTLTAGTAEAYYWRAQAYSKLSEQCFERLARMPSSGAMHELMADVYRIQGKYDLSALEWQSALQAAPEDRRLKEGLARALWLNRDYEKARPLLEDLVKLEPESAELNFETGDVLSSLNATEQAIHYLETAVRNAPEHIGAQASLGRAYLRVGQPARAIPHLKAALALDEEGSLYYQLAKAYEGAGQAALAQQTLRKYRAISGALQEKRSRVPEEYEITPP